MKGQLRIDEMFAYVCLDDDGTEGVPAFLSNGVAYPLMGADTTKMEQYRPLAEQIARERGLKITLCKFSKREELEVIE